MDTNIQENIGIEELYAGLSRNDLFSLAHFEPTEQVVSTQSFVRENGACRLIIRPGRKICRK